MPSTLRSPVVSSIRHGVAVVVVAAPIDNRCVVSPTTVAVDRGLDRLVGAAHVCFAIPLAVFGAEHLFGPRFVIAVVPPYMPSRLFWVYFVGCALIAASASIAAGVAVRWSGLLVGIMMFLFVAMIHLPGALAQPNRIIWTIVFREMSFGGAAWILAGTAMDRGQGGRTMIAVGSVFVALDRKSVV